jgi:hypothetical protein
MKRFMHICVALLASWYLIRAAKAPKRILVAPLWYAVCRHERAVKPMEHHRQV